MKTSMSSVRMDWNNLMNSKRLGEQAHDRDQVPARNAFCRDFDRVLFSNAFRRLHDKTQLFPMPENDHVHSRLTRSLEVASVGRSLGNVIGGWLRDEHPNDVPGDLTSRDFGDVVAAACLAHDIGNPPFGHAGEDAMATWFRQSKAVAKLKGSEKVDLLKYEGNAAGFRVITHLQRPKDSGGLRLTFATLGAFLKYPRASKAPKAKSSGKSNKKFSFFAADRASAARVAEECGLIQRAEHSWARHPLAFLMEAADDICYRVLDLEDGYRLGLVSFEEFCRTIEPIASKQSAFDAARKDEYGHSFRAEYAAYLRGIAINQLISSSVDVFKANYDGLMSGTWDYALTEECSDSKELEAIEVVTVRDCYGASVVLEIEVAGYQVLAELLRRFDDATSNPTSPLSKKVLGLFPALSALNGQPEYDRLLGIADVVGGMTDQYALATYRRLSGITLGPSSR